MYTFKKVLQSQIPWKTIEGSLDSTCFHSEKWNNYLNNLYYEHLDRYKSYTSI